MSVSHLSCAIPVCPFQPPSILLLLPIDIQAFCPTYFAASVAAPFSNCLLATAAESQRIRKFTYQLPGPTRPESSAPKGAYSSISLPMQGRVGGEPFLTIGCAATHAKPAGGYGWHGRKEDGDGYGHSHLSTFEVTWFWTMHMSYYHQSR